MRTSSIWLQACCAVHDVSITFVITHRSTYAAGTAHGGSLPLPIAHQATATKVIYQLHRPYCYYDTVLYYSSITVIWALQTVYLLCGAVNRCLYAAGGDPGTRTFYGDCAVSTGKGRKVDPTVVPVPVQGTPVSTQASLVRRKAQTGKKYDTSSHILRSNQRSNQPVVF